MGMACAGATAFMAMASWRSTLDLDAGVAHVAVVAGALVIGVVILTGTFHPNFSSSTDAWLHADPTSEKISN